ncbi:MAG: hypothetical protein JWQ27_355 [Ferruginibacter sp.]|nr:hypothetical protein [Ferruginibacter sp.]
MKAAVFFRIPIFILFVLISGAACAQANNELAATSWSVKKATSTKTNVSSAKLQQELNGVLLTFATNEVTVSRRTGTTDTLIKKGNYSVSGNVISLGKNKASYARDGDHLTITVANQGIFYLEKVK